MAGFLDANGSLSIQGKMNRKKQEPFEEKEVSICTHQVGVKIFSSFNIGYVCVRGNKPDIPNQDDFAISLHPTYKVFAVFDGHGKLGHVVSDFVKFHMMDAIASGTRQDEGISAMFTRMFLDCSDACKLSEEKTSNRDLFDCTYSGSTCTVALVTADAVHVAFVGDSRCILAVETGSANSNKYQLHQMTVDQNGYRSDEKARIEANGGEIVRISGDMHPRVFVKGQYGPGLAMTRSIGDLSGAPGGIIPNPEVSKFAFKHSSKRRTFIVVASDGVWEFLSSNRVLDLVASFGHERAQDAATAITQEAQSYWRSESPSSIDDITCIVAWLN